MTKSSYAEGNRLLGLGIISWCHILFSFIAFGSPKFALAVWLLGGSRVLLVLYLLVLFLPLLSACLAGLWGRKLGSKGASLISCLLIGLTALISFWLFFEVVLAGSSVYLKLGR